MVYGNWVPFSFWIAKFLFLCQMYKPGIWSFFRIVTWHSRLTGIFSEIMKILAYSSALTITERPYLKG